MAQQKHTPAPWINRGEDYEDSGIPFIQIETDFRGEKTMFIARVEANHETVGFNYELTDEDRANADLIAAAPDLLAALEGLMAAVDYTPSRAYNKLDLPYHAAKAAIAKSRGEA